MNDNFLESVFFFWVHLFSVLNFINLKVIRAKLTVHLLAISANVQVNTHARE